MKKNVADRRKVFWIVLAVILVVGAIPRVLIYDNSLPYIDHPDEPSLYLLAQQWRGEFQFPDPDYHRGYPPIYPAINLVVQLVMEQLGQPVMGDVIGVLRLISVVFSVLTALFVALIARALIAPALIGDVAGWLAALFWSLSPVLVREAPRALSDPLASLFTTAALWLAVMAATDKTKRHWAVWSILCGAVGILVKYPVAPVLAAGGLVIAWVLFKESWRHGLRLITYSALIMAAVLVVLLLNEGLGYSTQFVAHETRTTGLANLFQPRYALENLKYVITLLDPVTWTSFAVLMGLGALAFFIARRQQRPQVHVGGLALVGLMLIIQPWAVTSFSVISETFRFRDVYPAASAAVVVFSVALVQIAAAFPKRWGVLSQAVMVTVASLTIFWPQLAEIRHIVDAASPADTRVDLRAWSETTLEPGWVLVTKENEKVFNNYWSGLPGSKWFNWLEIERITATPLSAWRDRAITYAVLPQDTLDAIERTPAGQAYLDEMLLLRQFYAPPGHQGPDMSVYRLWRMEEETDVSFGDSIRLVGYDWDQSLAADGDAITLRLYWQADHPPRQDYSLFIHIVPEDNRQPVVQWDGPAATPSRPIYTWDEATETLIGATITLKLPGDMPAGSYRVLLGIYDFTTGQRLPVSINQEVNVVGVLGGDSLHLKTVMVD